MKNLTYLKENTKEISQEQAREKINITLKIHRYDPEKKKSWIQTYDIKVGPIMRFVDILRKINNEQDPTLAWSSSCEHGQCGSCAIKINGKPMLACELLVMKAVEQFGTTTFVLEPIDVAPVVRDLVVDMEDSYKRIEQIKPYIINPTHPPDGKREHVIEPKVMERYVDATRCINCFCCTSACIASNRNFLGPNAMLALISRIMDPREKEKKWRYERLYSEEGIYRCHSSRACSFVCPKEIDVAHFIAMAKRGDLETK